MTTEPRGPGAPGRLRGALGLLRFYGLPVALALSAAILSVWAPSFLTASNLVNIVLQISINGILAVGVTLVLLTGGVDLSLGSVVALTGVVAARCAQDGGDPLVALGAGLGAGLLCGLYNGGFVAFARVAPFIATLGMMLIARGLALQVSGGRPVSGLSPAFTALGRSVAGIPVPVLVLAVVAVAAAVLLHRTPLGRRLYAVGGNAKAARAAGVSVVGVRLFAYGACGALAGLAGVILAARITTGQPNAGQFFELDAIAAAVVGGVSLAGGVGGVGGALLGALLLGVIHNGLELLGVPPYVLPIVKGKIIILAAWLDRRHAE